MDQLQDMPTESTAILEPRAVGYVLELVRARVAELEEKGRRYSTARRAQHARRYRAELELVALRPTLAELERAERAHVDSIVSSLAGSSSRDA